MESQQADQMAVLMRSVAQDKAQLALDKKLAGDALAQQQQVLNQAAAAKKTILATLQKEKDLLSNLTAEQQQQVQQVTGGGSGTTAVPRNLPSSPVALGSRSPTWSRRSTKRGTAGALQVPTITTARVS